MSSQQQDHSISSSSQSDDEYGEDLPSNSEDGPSASHQTPDQHQHQERWREELPRSYTKIPNPQLRPEVQHDFSILFHIFSNFFRSQGWLISANHHVSYKLQNRSKSPSSESDDESNEYVPSLIAMKMRLLLRIKHPISINISSAGAKSTLTFLEPSRTLSRRTTESTLRAVAQFVLQCGAVRLQDAIKRYKASGGRAYENSTRFLEHLLRHLPLWLGADQRCVASIRGRGLKGTCYNRGPCTLPFCL